MNYTKNHVKQAKLKLNVEIINWDLSMDIEWNRFFILNRNCFLSVETYWSTRGILTTEI